MGMNRAVAALGSVAIVAGAWAPATAAPARLVEPSGLWSTGFEVHQAASDCGEWRLDKNDFCVADDSRNGVELGVRFQASTELVITGVRIYRVDPGKVKASLWDTAGNRLAQGTFAEAAADNGWQDMTFAAPVTIAPGTTYVASFFTPATKYAFSYEYFKDAARTVGPVTALASTEADPNGVHCYDDAACGAFPVNGYKNSSYWVTPLWQTPDAPTPGTPPDPTADQKAPRVTSTVPSGDAKQAKVGTRAKVKVSFSEPVRPTTITRTTVRLLVGRKATPVKARLRYHADRHRVVLTPRRALRAATTYRVTVTTRIKDLAGNRLDQVPGKAGLQKATWTFRTR